MPRAGRKTGGLRPAYQQVLSVVRQNLVSVQLRVIRQKREGEDQQTAFVLFEKGADAAVPAVQIALQHGQQAHILLPAVRVGVEERIVGVQIDGGACQAVVPPELFDDEGLQIIGTGAADVIRVIIPYEDRGSRTGGQKTDRQKPCGSLFCLQKIRQKDRRQQTEGDHARVDVPHQLGGNQRESKERHEEPQEKSGPVFRGKRGRGLPQRPDQAAEDAAQDKQA